MDAGRVAQHEELIAFFSKKRWSRMKCQHSYLMRQTTFFRHFLIFKMNGSDKFGLGICSISCSHLTAFSFMLLLSSAIVALSWWRWPGERGQWQLSAWSGPSFCRNVIELQSGENILSFLEEFPLLKLQMHYIFLSFGWWCFCFHHMVLNKAFCCILLFVRVAPSLSMSFKIGNHMFRLSKSLLTLLGMVLYLLFKKPPILP